MVIVVLVASIFIITIIITDIIIICLCCHSWIRTHKVFTHTKKCSVSNFFLLKYYDSLIKCLSVCQFDTMKCYCKLLLCFLFQTNNYRVFFSFSSGKYLAIQFDCLVVLKCMFQLKPDVIIYTYGLHCSVGLTFCCLNFDIDVNECEMHMKRLNDIYANVNRCKFVKEMHLFLKWIR